MQIAHTATAIEPVCVLCMHVAIVKMEPRALKRAP